VVYDGWWLHPKHVEQFPDKINCVTLHLVGHILECNFKTLFCSYNFKQISGMKTGVNFSNVSRNFTHIWLLHEFDFVGYVYFFNEKQHNF